MNIYVGHSSSIDYEKKLYQPLKDSSLNKEHNLVLPHEQSNEPFNSKSFLKNRCDLFIAEVSKASTGLGIELGWADMYDIPVVCIYRKNTDISSSLSVLNIEMIEYADSEEMIESLSEIIKDLFTG